MFKWFDTSEVNALAVSLASEFMQRVPQSGGPVRGAQGRTKEATAAILARVQRFARTNKLNLFKRARLANSLKWQLHEAGYDKELVDALTLDVAKIASVTKYVGKQTTSNSDR